MKRILVVVSLLALSVTALSVSAMAAPPKPPEKFYNMDAMVLDGEIKRPTAVYSSARRKAEFGRLLHLKKSFLPAIFETAKEHSLR